MCRGSHTESSPGADDRGHEDRPANGVQDGRGALERGNSSKSHLMPARVRPSPGDPIQNVIPAQCVFMSEGCVAAVKHLVSNVQRIILLLARLWFAMQGVKKIMS